MEAELLLPGGTAGTTRWVVGRAAIAIASLGLLVLLVLLPPVYVLLAAALVAGLIVTLRFPVAGFCLLAFSIPWTSSFALPVAGFPVTFTDVLVASLAVGWFVSLRHEKSRTAPWTPFLLAFIVAIILSTTQAEDSHAALREIVKWAEVAMVYVSASRLLTTRRELLAVVAALIAAGVSEALLGYVQFLFQLGPEPFRLGRFLRAYGTFDQPNPYAGFLNMTMPFALAGSILSTGRRRWWSGVSLLLIVGALLASESRGALIAGLLAGVVVVGCIARPLARLAWTGLLALVAGGLLASFGLVPLGPFARLLNAVGLGGIAFGDVNDANYSAVERAAHWLAGVRMFSAHPLLGVGIGNYEIAYPDFHPRGWYAALAHAHNYYINLAAEAGIVGLTAYALLAGSALWYSYAAKERVHGTLARVAVLGALGALVATSIHNLFDVLYVHGMAALVGLLVALVTVATRLQSRYAHETVGAGDGNSRTG